MRNIDFFASHNTKPLLKIFTCSLSILGLSFEFNEILIKTSLHIAMRHSKSKLMRLSLVLPRFSTYGSSILTVEKSETLIART